MKWQLTILCLLLFKITASPYEYKCIDIEMPNYSHKLELDDFILKIIEIESSNNPNAISEQGAIGLMQIMPSTAIGYGYSPKQMFNPYYNTNVGKTLIKDLMKEFNNDTIKVLASYNYGQGRVKKLIKKYNNDWIEELPQETKNYLNKFKKNDNVKND